MKRNVIVTFLACGAGALLCVSAQGQTPAEPVTTSTSAVTTEPSEGHHHGGAGPLQHLADALSLSGSQQTAIAPIVESAVQQIEQIHQQAKSQTVDVINSASGQITPLLTPDQQAKFAKIVQDLEAHGGPGMAHHAKFAGHGGPGNQLGMLTQKLGLSPDQQNQVKPILDAAHAQVKAIFTNTSLTREQKLAQVKETMQGAFGQINGLLTPEQQTQFAAMKEKMHNHLHHQGPPASAPSVSGTTTSPI